MVELQDLSCRIVEVDMQDFPTIFMNELELCELIEIQGTPIRLAEGQILEEFMLEEEIEFQGVDECKSIELPDDQEIERGIDRETVGPPEMPVRIACEQEECIEEENCNRSLLKLPKLYRAEESIQKDELKLETPIINKVEINKLPEEIVQNVSLVSYISTPFHAVANRNVLDKAIPRLHTRRRKVLGSKLVRRVNTTRLANKKIPSICRPPPKPPDRQNRLKGKVSKRILSPMHAKGDKVNYRPPSKPSYIVNVNGEVIGIIEREDLPYVVPKPKPPPKPPPKSL